MSELPPIHGDKAQNPSSPQDELDAMARRVLQEIATLGTVGANVELDGYIRILAEYRTSCEARENYKEAELVQHVLKHLRLEEETRHVKGLTEMQENERRGLEEAHMMEFSNFNRVWNAKIDAFETRQLDQESALLEEHALELGKFHEEMKAKGYQRVKYSKDLLNLRSIQHTLAMQRNYTEAQRVKVKGDKIESSESERIAREQADYYEKKENIVLARHRQEVAALRKRMETAKLELERARKREMEMLLQRYNNVRRGLEAQQSIIRSKTGNLLLKHANNKKTDISGSQAIVHSMASGAFGPGVKRRHQFAKAEPLGSGGRDFDGADNPNAAQQGQELPPLQ